MKKLFFFLILSSISLTSFATGNISESYESSSIQTSFDLSEEIEKLISTEININNEYVIDISNIKENPTSLIKWLYENQGEMRFSSENRLFMVFVDKTEYEKSWKLKSDKQKLEVKINNFLSNNYITYDIDFKFKGKNYKTKSSLILIENE